MQRHSDAWLSRTAVRLGTLGALTLVALVLPSSSLALPTLLADQSPDPTYFDGNRSDPVVWDVTPPDPLPAWSIVAIVRPTPACAAGTSRTLVTNDLAGWNDDVLLGICPEADTISPAGRWALIHQDDGLQVRSMAVVNQTIAGDTWYHVAATSDGSSLRLYVNGHLRSCPAPKIGPDLDLLHPGTTYIGGNGNANSRYFQGDIASVKIYDGALTACEVASLAWAAGLYTPESEPWICTYVEDVVVEAVEIDSITSIDFVNGYEVVSDLGHSRFVYRPIGGASWLAAAPLAPTPLNGQHSIAWAALDPPRYFVPDSGNDRVVSFTSLDAGTIYSEKTVVAGVVLERPHDQEYNAEDGYLYGVTAPYPDAGDKVLFRFNNVDEGTLVLAGCPPGTSLDGCYTRSLSIVDGVVYVVDSYGQGVSSPPFAPRVFEIHDFVAGVYTTYHAGSAWSAEMQDVELHNGWWYGTGTNKSPMSPLLARWRTWADFASGTWEDLSGLLPPVILPKSRMGYFLTEWRGRLFFAALETDPVERRDWVFELIDGSVDLTVTTSDGQDSVPPGEPVTYTIVVSNQGPDDAFDAQVCDRFPAALAAVDWTCVATGGATCGSPAGSGDIDQLVDLPVGGTVTFTATGIVDPAATGALINTAVASPRPGIVDPDCGNNTGTDVDTLTPTADLAITNDDGQATAVPGEQVTYTVVAANSGPSDAPGAAVADSFPAELIGVSWTCVGTGGGVCANPSGLGDIDETVELPADSSVTFTATATVDPAATGVLVTTALVLPPGRGAEPSRFADPDPGNNAAADADLLTPEADLQISKDDGSATAVPGLTLSYTIVGANPGPSDAPGATVADSFPAELTGVSWTCSGAGGASCTASGSGDISDTVGLPAGGSVTYTATATLDPGAAGALANSVTVEVPAGVAERNPADNSATDTDTVEQTLFADGFESGDTSAWSVVVP